MSSGVGVGVGEVSGGMTPSNWTGLAVSIFLPLTRRLLMKRKANNPRHR